MKLLLPVIFSLGIILFGAAVCSTIEKANNSGVAWLAHASLMLVWFAVFIHMLGDIQ